MSDFGSAGFTADDITDLTGRTYAITGANSGIGLEAARHMGRKGARIILLCRSAEKAMDAMQDLRTTAPQGQYDFIPLDLGRLASVRDAAQAINGSCDGLDGMINNAGLMMIPTRTLTEDGFETQYGVNFLGHFLLDALVAENVERAQGRIVSVSSIAHHYAKTIPFDDLTYEKAYSATHSYAVSKLANLAYSFELQRRLSAHGKKTLSVACHPGWSATHLQTTGPGKFAGMAMTVMNKVFAQPAEKGALPTVLAATSPHAVGGGYYGPAGARQFKGPVKVVPAKPWAVDPILGRKLWENACALTGQEWLM